MAVEPISKGSQAPSFTLIDQNGNNVSLDQFKGKNLVLYFYPKDFTPGCTAESCGFRDHYGEFGGLDAEIVGVSGDSPESHFAFSERYQLPFTLLSDPGNRTAALYGVGKTLGILPGRVTFVIDRQGVIRERFSSQLNIKQHLKKALQALQ